MVLRIFNLLKIKSVSQNSRMRNNQLIAAMSIEVWTIISLGIDNTKLRVSVNLNWEKLKQNNIRYFEKIFLMIGALHRMTSLKISKESFLEYDLVLQGSCEIFFKKFVCCLYTFYVFILFKTRYNRKYKLTWPILAKFGIKLL